MARMIAALLALTLLSPAVSVAGSPAVKAQKQEVKEARQDAKRVDRLVRKWTRAADKGKTDKVARVEADLEPYVADEIARLRKAGFTRNFVIPSPMEREAWSAWAANPRPEKVALKDDLWELKALGGSTRQRDMNRKAKLLTNLQDELTVRHARKDAKLDKLKG